MKLKNVVRSFPIFTASVIAAVIFTAVTAILGKTLLALAEAAAIAVIVALTLVYYFVIKKRKQNMIGMILRDLNFGTDSGSADFPLPVLITEENGKFVWYNRLFEDGVIPDGGKGDMKELIEKDIDMFLNAGPSGVGIQFGEKYYTVYTQLSSGKLVLVFSEITKLRRVADEFLRTRPAVILISIDGMEETHRLYRDSDCTAIRNGIEKLIDVWMSDYGTLMTKRGDNSFVVVTKTGDVEKMIEKKFDILDKVRSYTYNEEPLSVTLSIGVGMEGGVETSEEEAKNSLEMAFGRGGDQAVVKFKDAYEFYGGVSKSVERQTKVRARIVANAFCELLESCDKVIVMGHRFPDLDALGSALGIVAIARSFSKEAYIATDIATSLSKPLIEYMSENGFGDYIVSSEKAKTLFKKNTLLVVTDTHIKSFTECPELLDKAESTVIIDHHRKSVGFIENSDIFFHDPAASSACELVTQMIRYLPGKIKIGSVAADALLSGIMLDTKNFVLRTGINTFETAAYLKSAGADTVRVKKLFDDNMAEYKAKCNVVSSAVQYRNCAISKCEDSDSQVRIVAAQAADELLSIKGVDASFVMFRIGNTVSISARSLGKINVQLIMEKLGGGGHQTMAAAQFENEDFSSVHSKLTQTIDEFIQ